MRRVAGQAGRLLHRLMQAALALVFVAACLSALLAWRLSRGPLEMAWMAHRLEAAVNTGGPIRLAVGGVSVAWTGFRDGVGAPLELRVVDAVATDHSGAELAKVASVDVALSMGSLLLARVEPRSIDVTGAHVGATRAANGRFSLDLGDLGEATQPDARGGEGAAGRVRWEQLRRVRVHDASATVVDRVIGVTWRIPMLEADLLRGRDGDIAGQARASLALGDQSINVDLKSAGLASAVDFQVSPFNPARLASLAPAFAPLAALDAAVTLVGHADLGPNLLPTRAAVTIEAGAGTAHIAQGTSPLLGATLALDGTMDRLEATLRRLELAPRPDGPKTLVHGHLLGTRRAGHLVADITLDLDQVAFADLAALWPVGVGGRGLRPWITENITDGVGRNAHLAAVLDAPQDFSDLALQSIDVAVDGHDLTVHWLRPIPPTEHVEGHLSMKSPDTMDISLSSGHQAGGALFLRNGHIRLTGLAVKDQFADIDMDIAGPLADVVTLLRHPRLKLLNKSPVQLRDVAGQLAGHVAFTHLPLEDNTTVDDIRVKTRAHVTGVHLGALVAGYDLDRGTLDLDASNDGLGVRGNATVGGIPAQMTFDMDFHNGPPSQVVEKVTAAGMVDEAALVGLGLGTSGILVGAVPVRADAQFQRGGRGDIALHADLAGTALQADAIDYRKAVGGAGTADAQLVLDRDRIVQMNQLRLVAAGVDIQGGAEFAGGRPSVVRLDTVRLGETKLSGEIRLPAKRGDAYVVRVAGPSLDASSYFGDSAAPSKPKDDAPGKPYSVDARFDRVLMAGRIEATGLVLQVDHDGRIIRQARARGILGEHAGFNVDVQPAGRGRHLVVKTTNGGGLLRATGVLKDVVGGQLSVTGDWDDSSSAHPLTGVLELDDFRIRNAPAFGKMLQAMTLYGVVDAVTTGPGLNFSRAVSPFRLSGGVLELSDARAFSASLGMTAKGSINLDRHLVNVQGTVVPAYFFNTLLGNVPLIGRLFSPEVGGGLFAATYSVTGGLDNPSVSVNPLAALTPGFLRGLFDGFQSGGPAVPQGEAAGGESR